jgi:hypothetical protein
MKPKFLLFLLLFLPGLSFCQTVENPSVASSGDPTTNIVKIEVSNKYTEITFKHISPRKGDWIQLNKSMYLQSFKGEDRYNFIKSENIPLRPLKKFAIADNEELVFKVYFEKLKPGTKAINVIERALSPDELLNGASFFNYFNVSLEKPVADKAPQVVSIKKDVVIDTVFNDAHSPAFSFKNDIASSMGPMISGMYNAMLSVQMKFYSDQANIDKMAQITKSYFDALIKTGFTADQALKIITSKQLVSMDMNAK